MRLLHFVRNDMLLRFARDDRGRSVKKGYARLS